MSPSAACFGVVKRQIGVRQEIIGVRAVYWADRYAGASSHDQVMTINGKRLTQVLENGAYDLSRQKRIATIFKNHDKFISAQPVDMHSTRNGLETPRYFLQEAVTERMTKGVIDVFESVKIKHRDGD
jgi:hypothetical protein